MCRLDRMYPALKAEVPYLSKKPSEYILSNCYFSTQPIEEPDEHEHLLQMFEMLHAEKTVIFASDYPHWDFDNPLTALQFLPPATEAAHLRRQRACDFFGPRVRCNRSHDLRDRRLQASTSTCTTRSPTGAPSRPTCRRACAGASRGPAGRRWRATASRSVGGARADRRGHRIRRRGQGAISRHARHRPRDPDRVSARAWASSRTRTWPPRSPAASTTGRSRPGSGPSPASRARSCRAAGPGAGSRGDRPARATIRAWSRC